MDKKTKKQLTLLRERAQRLQRQLAAEKKQTDDPTVIVALQEDLERLNREIAVLQGTK